MGSKRQYAKYIVPILQKAIDDNNVDTYIECFVGGANIIDKIKCDNKYGYDSNDTLIALLDQASKDFSKIPTSSSRELWDKGRAYKKDGIMPDDMTLVDIGAVEFFSSYGNAGFHKGYVGPLYEKRNGRYRDYYEESYRSLKKQAPNLSNITFKCQEYQELTPTANAVIYLDPPYAGTTQYTWAKDVKIDYNYFWNWVRELSKNNWVFISEQNAPEDFEVIWEREVTRTMSKNNKCKATEKLFRLKK